MRKSSVSASDLSLVSLRNPPTGHCKRSGSATVRDFLTTGEKATEDVGVERLERDVPNDNPRRETLVEE